MQHPILRFFLTLLCWVVLTCYGFSQVCTDPRNLSLGQSVQQSSVYGLGLPEVAVDGDLDGSRGPWGVSPSIIHTQRELQPWWEVDLSDLHDLDTLKIYNRTDCCGNRLRDFYVLVSSSPFPTDASLDGLLADNTIEVYHFPGVAGDTVAINLAGVSGQFVRVQLSGEDILNLAEIEVWGCENVPPPPPCDKPFGLSSDVTYSDHAILSWEGPVGALLYELRYRLFGTEEWTVLTDLSTTQVELPVTRETEYRWEVRQVCEGNTSDWAFDFFNTVCFDAEALSNQLEVSQVTSTSAYLDWNIEGFNPYFGFRYRVLGDREWIYGAANNPNQIPQQALLENLSPNTSYEWQGALLCDATPIESFIQGPNFTTLSETPQGPTADLRFVPTLDCDNNQFRAKIQVRSATDDVLRLGTSSLFFTFENTALQFANYQSLRFDGSDQCIANVAQAWDPHNYDATSDPGRINITLVLNNEGFGCPDITSAEWIDFAEITFDILDDTQDPTLQFDRELTNFNVDQPNDGSVELGKGDFMELAEFDLGCTPLQAPIPDIAANPLSGTAPLLVSFDGTASSDPDGSLISFDWIFGDGESGDGSFISHTYTQPGVYTATLALTDDDGLTASESVEIVVNPPLLPPVASFTATPTSGAAPLPVAFDGSASIDPDGEIVGYAWFFGDGTEVVGATPAHTYTIPGTYQVACIVIDSDGLRDTAGVTITVEDEFVQNPCETYQNLALGKAASQSSTYGLGVASIAVDGDLDGARGPWGTNPSIMHTLEEGQPWWQVDLNTFADLDSIKIYNRTNCCGNRLRNFYVFVSETPFAGGATLESLLADGAIWHTSFPGVAGDSLVVPLTGSQGQYVRIQLAGEGIIHLAEIQVWGCESSPPPAPCPEPSNLLADVNTPFKATLAWQGVPAAISYELRYKSYEEETWTILTNLSATQQEIDVLTDTGYDWEVRSQCEGGFSEWVGDVFISICQNANEIADQMSVSQITSTSAFLDWYVDDGLYSGPYASFRYRVLGETEWILVAGMDPILSSQVALLENLSPNTTYEWEGEIFCLARNFLPGPNFTTLPEPSPCPAPTGLYADVSFGDRGRLVWQGVADASYYDVRYREVGSQNWFDETLIPVPDLVILLDRDREYEWEVRSVCQEGPSEWAQGRFYSACFDVETISAEMTVTEITSTSALLDWSVGDLFLAPFAHFRYRVQGDLAWIDGFVEDPVRATQRVRLENLLPNTTYEWEGEVVCTNTDNRPFIYGPTFTTLPQENIPPVANFVTNLTSGTAPLSVSFDASASNDPDGTIVSYAWDFGDGNVGTGVNAAHTYEIAGTYVAQLIITDDSAASATFSQEIQVNPLIINDNPVADLRFVDSLDCATHTFYSTIQIRSANASAIEIGTTSILFTYNDTALQYLDYQSLGFDGSGLCIAGVASSWDPHAYDGSSVPGTFNLTMVLNSDNFSCPTITQNEWVSIGQLEFFILDDSKDPRMTFDTTNTNFNVDDPNDGSLTVGKGNFAGLSGFILDCPNLNIPPSAFFSVNSQGGFAPLLVSFDASGSTDPDGTIVSYLWDFGDGNTGTGISPTHTYQAEGEFIATLIVTDDSLSADTFQLAINVEPTISDDPCDTPQNLALGKVASQSSTYGAGAALYAVDGNPIGSSPWSADLQHTQSELSPWWEVDLAESANLDSVRIYNRSNCCQNRLQNFYLLVSELPFDPTLTLDELLTSPVVSATFFPGIWPDSISTLALGERGRYLRIQLQSSGRNTSLHLAEVEVWGCIGTEEFRPLEFAVRASDADCMGDSTGSIDFVEVGGGIPPYSYSIDGGCSFVSSPNFPGLTYGDFLAVVQDSDGNQSQQVVSIGSQSTFIQINNIQRIVDPNGSPVDHAGYEVAMIEGEALVSARWAEGETQVGDYNSGEVWIMRKVGESWEISSIFESPRPQRDAFFGYKLAMNKEWALIGTQEDNGAGSVYFFRKENDSWVEFQRVVGTGVVPGETFGGSVSISGKTAAISSFSSRRSFIYSFNGNEWVEDTALTVNENGQENDAGTVLSLSGDRLLIGRRFDNFTGTAYIYKKTPDGWEVEASLTGSDGRSGGNFGQRVALSGDWAFVGAEDDQTRDNSGAVYVFKYEGGQWREVQKLALEVPIAGGRFGVEVKVKGDMAVIGANGINDATGSAYLYKRVGDTWALSQELSSPDLQRFGSFGLAVDLAGKDVLVGAFGEDGSGFDQGAVYAFEIDCNLSCEQDYNALMAIYQATGGENWENATNWGVGCPCENEWEGIGCDAENNIISLNLSFMRNVTGDIPEELGDLISLQELILAANPITSLPESIGNLTNLENLILDETEISELPASFGDLSSLKDLNLFRLPLDRLPESFGNLSQLQEVSMSITNVRTLPESFGNLSSLAILNMDENQLEYLPESFGNLDALLSLNLSGNQLAFLPESMGDLASVFSVEISNNNISCFPTSMTAYCLEDVTVNASLNPADWDSFCESGENVCDSTNSDCNRPTNLALNQPASQSSTYGLGAASVAVDGDTDGTRGPWGTSPSIQHTNNEAQPWWEVELAELSDLSSVTLYNRTNCCENRLKEFYLFVSQSPFGTRSLDELLADTSISQTYVEAPVGASLSIDTEATGRYVRIQLTGNGILHMAEVEVRGCPHNEANSSQRFSRATEEVSEGIPASLIQAYPNPFSQEIQIDLGEDWESAIQVQVYNALGQRLHAQRLGQSRLLALGQSWPAGIYWLEVRIGSNIQTLQVVKR